MRKIFLTLSLAVATLIMGAASANATVAVDNGVGFVGKGDVQTALGLANDQAMQNLHKADGVKFTNGGSTGIQTITQTVQCKTFVGAVNKGTVKWVLTNPFTDTVNVTAVANTNAAGKLTNGWNLTGNQTAERVLGKTTTALQHCPSGQYGSGIIATTVVDSNVVTTSGLKVNGVDLPNTPVEAPVV